MPYAMERKASAIYRRFFVNLEKVAEMLAERIPPNALVLDIGGGDGELLNCLFALRPDLNVTMVDIASSVGKFVEPQHMDKVTFCPGTPIQTHLENHALTYDAAIVSDVMHHIPKDIRREFLKSIHGTLKLNGILLIKDVEPGSISSFLNYCADTYISGDKNVAHISRQDLISLVEKSLPSHQVEEIDLYRKNKPNYIINFSFEQKLNAAAAS
jgi:2-polyprenyl-3-methyl-5-hydroxy-6-metoxy-1,4-benzoquinol methylase